MYAWVPTNGPPLMAASCLGKEQLVSCSNEREGGEILTREAELMETWEWLPEEGTLQLTYEDDDQEKAGGKE